jgi:hypothetical protein
MRATEKKLRKWIFLNTIMLTLMLEEKLHVSFAMKSKCGEERMPVA